MFLLTVRYSWLAFCLSDACFVIAFGNLWCLDGVITSVFSSLYLSPIAAVNILQSKRELRLEKMPNFHEK